MKKAVAIIITLAFVLNFVTVFSASKLPFTDEDYLRDDFGINDYRQYITDSVDNKGYQWPAGTTVIDYESPQNPYKNISNTSPSPQIPETAVILGFRCFENRTFDSDVLDLSYLKDLKFIGERAFNNSFKANFSRVDLSGTSLVRIGEYAFNGCLLKTLILPDTIKRIDNYAFVNLKCGVLELPEGLLYIGDCAFSNTTQPVIPKSVQYIGYNAFAIDASCKVYEGSYAEEWCKANGRKYMYIEEEPKPSAEELENSVKIGPVTFTGYAGYHIYTTRMDDFNNRVEVMWVDVYRGGKIISDVDGADFMYTPVAWCLDYPEGIGRSDNVFNIYPITPKNKILKTIKDYKIIPHLSQKLPDGTWAKGLAWELNWDIMGPVEMVVSANGRNYLYAIFVLDPGRKTADGGLSKKDAVPTSSKVLIDGKEVSFDAYNIKDNNYFKLRDVAMALSGSGKQFNVTWNGEENCIDMLSGTAYTPVGGELAKGDGTVKTADNRNPSQLLKDSVPLFMSSYNINGNNYFKLRDLGKEFNFSVSWDGVNNCILIETDVPYSEN